MRGRNQRLQKVTAPYSVISVMKVVYLLQEYGEASASLRSPCSATMRCRVYIQREQRHRDAAPQLGHGLRTPLSYRASGQVPPITSLPSVYNAALQRSSLGLAGDNEDSRSSLAINHSANGVPVMSSRCWPGNKLIGPEIGGVRLQHHKAPWWGRV